MVKEDAAAQKLFPVVRYPGGKQAMLRFLSEFLPDPERLTGRYVEPFVGGAAVFLFVNPQKAILADSNAELIDLYQAIRSDPEGVWQLYKSFGPTKEDYLDVRSWKPANLDCTTRAARLLYLNRTCFKGNWRHNAEGEFNIGYGGQSRRWVITRQLLHDVAAALACADLRFGDFEATIEDTTLGDFMFIDPPYKPGERELQNSHYRLNHFKFEDHKRLAAVLSAAARRGVRWCMTTSAHRDILAIFSGFRIMPVPPRGKAAASGEVVILG